MLSFQTFHRQLPTYGFHYMLNPLILEDMVHYTLRYIVLKLHIE
jgi:hypothetical protein